jgi:hypothetical protein
MPECRQGFTLTQTHGLTFPLQPHYVSFKVPRKEAALQVPLQKDRPPSFVMSVGLHGTVWLPLDRFS